MEIKSLGGFSRMLLSLFLLALPVWAAAQQVTGIVQDVNGEPMIGVSVVVYGTNQGTITDINGNFSVNAKSTDQLVFSYVGYKTQYVKVLNRTAIPVVMQEDSELLDELVVVGYDTQKKVNLTGSVSSLPSEVMDNRPIVQASTALQGTMPGVTVSTHGGAPGDDSPSIRVRGLGTFGTSSSAPLVLIDGIEGDMNTVDANQIESISVLKDAASSAIYGSRAANGVILVTTKRASREKCSVTYKG